MNDLRAGTAVHFIVNVYARNEGQKQLIIELCDKGLKYGTVQNIILQKRGRKMSKRKTIKVIKELYLIGYSKEEIESILSLDEKTVK